MTALLALGLLLPGLGCAMCASPYDYCGPTFTGNDCGDPCFVNQRAGSIFDPAPVASPHSEYGGPYEGDEGVIESSRDETDLDAGESDTPTAPRPGTTLRPKPDRGVSIPQSSGGQHTRVANSFRR
jgi:hypothetical protein